MADFQPKWDADTLRSIIDSYKENPEAYPENIKQSIQQHAEYHNVPFYSGEFSIGDALSDLGAGFVEGFTTLRIGDTPDNEYEAIFKNLGHLAGFAPGIIGAPLGAAAKITSGVTQRSLLSAANMARKLNDKSVPMFVAKHATKKAKDIARPMLEKAKIGQSGATKTATDFLLGNRARHIAEGAFHLGVASGVSAWQGGVDEMMHAFIGGAKAGGVFRSIGNFVNLGTEGSTKVAKTLAGSLFMGLPATMRGATTPEQVYEYVMGAWFGGQERPWTVAKAGKFVQKYSKDAQKEGNEALKQMWDPEIHPEYKELPSEVKPVVKEMFQERFQTAERNEAALQYFAEQTGVNLKELGITAKTDLGKLAQEVSQKVKELDVKEKQELNEGSISDTDTGGMPTTDSHVGKRASYIVKRFTKELYQDIENVDAKKAKIEEIGGKVQKVLELNILKNKTDINPSENIVKEVQEMLRKDYGKFQIQNVDEFAGEMRQWASRRMNDAPVIHLTSNGKSVDVLEGRSNAAGNRKFTNEPLKNIDLLWNELNKGEVFKTSAEINKEWNEWISEETYSPTAERETRGRVTHIRRRDKPDFNWRRSMREYANFQTRETKIPHRVVETKQKDGSITYKFEAIKGAPKEKLERAFAILDHVVLGSREVELSRYRKKNIDGYEVMLEKAMKKLDKKENMYFFGGKGTDDRLYFMKHHPDMKKVKMSELKRAFTSKGVEIDALRVAFNKKFNMNDNYFDKAFKSNVLWTLSMNGLEYSPANLRKVLGPGFITNAIAWNKRNQIWMTDSYTAEKEFYNKKDGVGYISDLTKKGEEPGFEGGGFKFAIADEATVKRISKADKKLGGVLANRLSTEMSEHIDGAIIVRDDVIKAMNLDAGTPFSGQNKAFIISPSAEHGALLGKFMFHAAGEKQSEHMTQMGQHMLMQESAVKQMGTREFGPFYELDPSHIKYNYGVKQGSDMLKPQTIKKQLLTNLVESLAFNPALKDGTKMSAVVEDIFQTLVKPRFKGNKEANESLDKILDKLETASDKEIASDLDALKLEDVGIPKMISALNKPGNQLFVKKAYDMMLKNRKESLLEELEAGDIDARTYKEQNQELQEFGSLADRMITEARKEAIKRGYPENQASIFTHHFINNFRMKMLSNWIVKETTKPKIVNSGAARIRPYDIYLQENADGVNPRLKKLNKDDSLFFLDDAYRNMRIETDSWGNKRLEDLWKIYEDPRTTKESKKELDSVFRAAVMRVPMDSISGTQVLKFSGFTGRIGHGILMHSRAMRALGGADLDGDSAYFYMGGKGGFKESWKDMFEANKQEYYKKLKTGETIITDNKPEWAKSLLAEEYSPRAERLMTGNASGFAPNTRLATGTGAVEGRNLLGGAAVSPKNIMASAYQMILNSKNQRDTFTTKDKSGEIVWQIIPKTSKQEKNYIRELTRAMVGFSSDPMEFASLKSYQDWYRKMFDAHFKIIRYNKKHPKLKEVTSLSNLSAGGQGKEVNQVKYNGILGMLEKANSAYYGKDYTSNRQWTMDERYSMTEPLSKVSDSQITTITPKIAKLLHGIDYSDNNLRKIDAGKLSDLFTIYNKSLDSYSSFKDALGRTSFAVVTGKYINKTLEYELFNGAKVKKAANDDIIFADIISGTPLEYKKKKVGDKWVTTKEKAEYNYEQRVKILNRVRDMASDFVMKDIENLVTVKLATDVIDKIREANPGVSRVEINRMVSEISEKVNELKTRSYLLRKDKEDFQEDFDADFLARELGLPKEKIKGYERPRSKGTQELDQNQIDARIFRFKQGRSELENKLFDYLMLGSLRRTNLKKIAELKLRDNLTDKEQRYLNRLDRRGKRTASSRLGYASEAIPKESIGEFLGEMGEYYNEVAIQRAPKEVRKLGRRLVEEPQKEENVKQGFPETKNEQLEEVFTTGWEGIKGKKKVELDAETKSYIDDVLTHLKTENNKVSQNFNFIVRSLLEKDINLMNKQDWLIVRNWLDDIKTGTLWQRLKKGQFTKLSQRHYMQFPETIDRELMKDEIALIQEKGVFLTSEGKRMGKVLKPTQYMNTTMEWIGRTNEASLGKSDEIAAKLSKDLLFLDAIPDSKALHEVAVAVARERAMSEKVLKDKNEANVNWANSQTYAEQADKILKSTDYDKSLKDKVYTLTFQGKRQKLTGEGVIQKIQETYTEFFKEMHELATGNVKKTEAGDILTYTIPGLKDADGKLKQIPVIQDAIATGIEGFTSGPKGSGYVLRTKEHPTGFYDPKTRQNPIIDIPKFVNDMKAAVAKGKGFPTEFGVDGMQKIARSMMIEMGKHKFTKDELGTLYNTVSKPTGRIDFQNYWPHMHFNKKIALEALSKYAQYLGKTELPQSEMNEILKNLTYRHHALTGDWNFQDIETFRGYEEAMSEIGSTRQQKQRRIDWVKSLRKAGSMYSRDAHIPGYSLDRQVPITYSKSLVNTYFRQMAQIFSRDTINKFEKSMHDRKVPKEQREAWSNFLKLYVQGAIGNPDVVPEHILNDPKMKIRGTPYGWWADNQVKDRINKIGKTLGLLKTNLPENLRGIDLHDVKAWSNLEAKFELASLLAHPKSVVNNIFGGTMHTIQSVGFKTWRTARNNKLMATINPEWGSTQGRDNFAVKHGIFPEMLMEEYGLSREYQSSKNREFVDKIARKLSRDPNLSRESVVEMAKESGISKPVMELAAKFMSVPERALRRDAFMAHYLHWYNKLGGAIKDFNHPILIELAKKGVKATQFLYSAPYRPMFARTALGKVMTRFQLWGWNAVRFRKEALKQARIYGFQGEEAARAARIMQMDLFVFALGNAFAYSLFETAMPAPWNWVQDTADWVFGDEKERNRAFFGQWPRALAPLQTVTPPILRMPMASMRAILEDDWSRVSDYYIYTMFPFGRIIKDFHGPNNLIENPLALVDKWTGIPLISATEASKELRKGEERKVPTPGSGLY